MTNARVRVKNDLEAERTLDHLKRMRDDFDYASGTNSTNLKKARMLLVLDQAEKWYPNHEITIGMRSDYNFEFND